MSDLLFGNLEFIKRLADRGGLLVEPSFTGHPGLEPVKPRKEVIEMATLSWFNQESVQVGKVDLDTCGAAFLLGVSRGDKAEVLRGGQATEEDLANPKILCIEVGGSGRVAEANFDHHGPEAEGLSSATQQAADVVYPVGECQHGLVECAHCEHWDGRPYGWLSVKRLVDYIDLLDTEGPQALGPRQEGIFPTLSDVFAGMLLTERNPVEQLHCGVEILRTAVDKVSLIYGRMPIEEIPEWTAYAEAKAENNRQVAEAVERAQWGTTSSGLRLAWLETDFFGAPGALYGVGAQVVVAFSPHFGPARVPKFTVAGNGVRVDAVLSELNTRELGWGGPPTGTILGSPREGSRMTLEEVAEIVRNGL